MIKLVSKTEMGDFEFDFLTNVNITRSLENLTNTAKMIMPKKVIYKRDGKTISNIVEGDNPVFTRGNPVTLYAGYDDELIKLYEGYISNIVPRLPLEFEFQDDMWVLKQIFISKYAKNNLTLKQLLTDILPVSVQFQALDVKLGWFRITRSNVCAVLEHLRHNYGLTFNFKNKILYAGLRYITTDPLTITKNEFTLEENIIDDSGMAFVRSDDVRIKLKAISINDKNEKLEIEVGDKDGDARTMYFYGLDYNSLVKIANENISKLKYEGFRGSFETFLQPTVFEGEAVKIINNKLPEKNGVYLVKQVDYNYGVDGGRQVITLDRKIS